MAKTKAAPPTATAANPNTFYCQMFTALAQDRFLDAKRYYKQLMEWLNKKGWEPYWNEMPVGWSVATHPVDCFEVKAGQQVGKRMIVVYSYRNDAFTMTASGTSYRIALDRLIWDIELLKTGNVSASKQHDATFPDHAS